MLPLDQKCTMVSILYNVFTIRINKKILLKQFHMNT